MKRNVPVIAVIVPILLSWLGVPSTVVVADEPAWTETSVLDVIRRAIRNCDAYPLPLRPDAPPDQPMFPDDPGDYLKTIQPLLDDGTEVTPILQSLTSAASLSPLERLFASILLDRITHPEYFAAVAPHLSVANDPVSRIRVYGKIKHPGRLVAVIKLLEPELIPERLRERYQVGYERAQRIHERYYEKYQKRAKEPKPYFGSLAEAREREIAECRIHSDWMSNLQSSCVLAWTEGMLRPVPWPIKSQIAMWLGNVPQLDVSAALRRELIYAHTATMSNDYERQYQAQELTTALEDAFLVTKTPAKLMAMGELLTGTELLDVSEDGYFLFREEMLNRLNKDSIAMLKRREEMLPMALELEQMHAEYRALRPEPVTLEGRLERAREWQERREKTTKSTREQEVP